MGDLLAEFAALKISALSKSMIINQFVDEVTIGPNSTIYESVSPIKTTTTVDLMNTTDEISKPITDKMTPRNHRSTILARQTIHDIALSNIEKHRREKEHQFISIHNQKVENFNKRQEAQRTQQWKHQQALKLQEIQYQESLILQAMQQVEMESRKEFEKSSARNMQRQKENNQLLRAKAEEQQKLKKLVTDIIKVVYEFHVCGKEVDNLFTKNEEAKGQLQTFATDFEKIRHHLDDLAVRTKLMKVTEQDLHVAETTLKQVKQLKDVIRDTIKEYYSKRQKEAAEQVAILKKKEAEKAVQKKAEEDAQNGKNKIPMESGDKSLAYYDELQTFLRNHEQSYKQLLDDQSFKQFKFDCKKAVNIPVNAISAVSSSHLLDKYNKLHNLLSGSIVQIGDNRISASQHPQGVAFCTDLLAKKFVLQGDLTISSNPEAAFAYAAIIIALWNDFPIFGKLMLAHFHKECPYLVPLQLQRKESECDEDYYTKLGYKYKDGTIEKQDKFLKRMTGIARLYFAILVSKPKRGQNTNPHNLKYGWMWFARTLNMVPYVDVTSTVIYSFLEIAGSAMHSIYRNQFRKLIVYLSTYQIPILKAKDSGGPVARLELMLQDYYKTGNLISPSGMLASNFW